jgi:WS/DGAT/MGAT family acyltransferase
VKRLSGFDAFVLHLESATVYQHTLKIAVVAGTEDHPFDIDHLRRRMQRRLHLLAPLRYVLATGPGLHHPMWRENCEVDFDYHLREVVAPAPGGQEELDEVISRIVSSPLERSRPLWEMHAVTGLAEGRVALVTKMHHALADGLASANLLAMAVMSYPDEELAEYVPVPPDPVPTRWEVLRWAAVDHTRNLRALPGVLNRTVRGVHRMRTQGPRPAAHSAKLLDPPRIFTNGALSAQRRFTTSTLPLDEVQRVRKSLGITLNDAILGLVAGAMREMLLEVDGNADVPLVALVPVSVSFDTDQISGNRISVMMTSLPTQLSDPIERCRAASAAAKVSKENSRLLGLATMGELTEYIPGAALERFARRGSRTRRADRAKPQANLVVSNVPGPKEQIHIAGYPVTDLFSVGPLGDGCGVNITIWSYRDQLAVSVLTDAVMVPEPQRITAALAGAFEELRDAVEGGSNVGTDSAAGASLAPPVPPAPA